MKLEPLMDALIDLLLFLENSDDQAINPDATVGAMEGVAASLQQLGAAETRLLLDHIVARAAAAGARDRELIASLPEALGLERS